MFCVGCSDGLEPLNATIASHLQMEPEGDISFGTIPVGDTTSRLLTLRANGGSPLNIEDVYFSDAAQVAFSADHMSLPFGIQPNGIVDIELLFQPDEISSFNGQLYIFDGHRELSRRLLGHACTPGQDCS